MGFFSSVVSGVSNALSAAGSFISGAVSSLSSSIGGAISRLAPNIVKPFLGLGIGEILTAIQVISIVIGAIANILGVKEENESPEEIGMKAEEAEKQGIKPENFDSYQEYINCIRKEIQIDKNKLDNLSAEDKIKYGVVGSAILVKGIEEKEKFEIPAEFVSEIGRQNLSIEETRQYIKEFKSENLQLKDFTTYLKGTTEDKIYEKVGNAIESSIRALNPDISEQDLDNKIINMENEARK